MKIHKHFSSPRDLQAWIRSFNGQKNVISTPAYRRIPVIDKAVLERLSKTGWDEISNAEKLLLQKRDADGVPQWEKDKYGQFIYKPVLDKTGKQVMGGSWGFENDWTRTEQGIDMLGTGDMHGISEAQEFVKRFFETIERPIRTWQPSVAGAFPNVGRYLSNDPDSMWDQQEDLSDKTPIRIWVGVTTDIRVTDELIFKRGVILVALLLAIAERRPVYLTPYSVVTDETGGVCIISWDLQSSPFVFSEMASFTNSLITRYVGIYATTLANPELTSLRLYLSQEEGKRLMGFRKGDLMIPSGANNWTEFLDDPFAWISARCKEAWGEE